jgi:hypothetical protein
MTNIALPNPISTSITLTGTTRENYLAGLDAHFSRVGSPFGCQLHSSGNTLYIWPKEDPLRWVYVLAVTSAANPTGLSGWLDHSNDPTSSPSTLPEDPTTWLSPNATETLTQHVTGVAHTKFLVHEYGDAILIQELHSGNTYFTKQYHVGEIYAPAFTSASTLGMRGLGILGGAGGITTGQGHNWMSQTGGTSQLASRVDLRISVATSYTLWVYPRTYVEINTSQNPVPEVAAQSLLSPYICAANTSNSPSPYFHLGFYKYLARFHTTRPPGSLLEDSVSQIAYVCLGITNANTTTFARCQYGVSGIL